jgi:citrate lyase subunit beta/citryl-CoA lyase
MRSLLFAGALRPDLVAKLPRSRPDGAVIDLEDAVPAEAKHAARAQLAQLVRAAAGPSLFVRINAVGSAWFADDICALPGALSGVVVPKVESPDDVARVRAALVQRGPGDAQLVVGIESARGVAHVESTLAADVDVAYFGAEDYIADLGGRRTPEGREVLYARSRVALAARLCGVTVLDQVVTNVRDADAFRFDADAGRDLGYHGKLCVHPAQVEIANAVFGVADEAIDRARRMLAAADAAASQGIGAIVFEGEMIDAPALRMARATLRRAEGVDVTQPRRERPHG